MENTREIKVDYLRGIAIILVVAGHGMNGYDYLNIPYNFIYSVHMPLLFFLSGYLVEKKGYEKRNGEIKFISKKVSSLLLPFFSWTVLVPWMISDFDINILYNQIVVLTGSEGGGIWFLPVLFGVDIAYLIYDILLSRCKKKNIYIDFFIAMLVEGMLLSLYLCTKYPYIKNMLSYFLPFLFGVVIQKYEELRKVFGNDRIITLAIIGYSILFQFFDFYNTLPTTQIKRIVLGLLAIIVLWKLVDRKCYKGIVNKFIVLCGNNSLAIYLIHSYVGDWNILLQKTESMVVGIIISLGGSIAACLLCIWFSQIISCSESLSLCLLGKKNGR